MYTDGSYALLNDFVAIPDDVDWRYQPNHEPSRGASVYYKLTLATALRALNAVREDARQEGFDPPGRHTIAIARDLLEQLWKINERRYQIYAGPEGEVCIDAANGLGQSVLLLCEPDGQVLCIANLKSGLEHQRYVSSQELPNDFVKQSLESLRTSE